jgi:hypothetical protein
MTMRGRPPRRRTVARLVAAVTVGVLVIGLGAAPEAGTPLGTARPMSGFPAGEAYDIAATPPWWRSEWPAEAGVDVPASVTARPPTSETTARLVPGPPSPGAGSEMAVSGVSPEVGSEPVPDALDAEPVHGPDWVRRTEEGFEVSRGTTSHGSGPVVTYTVEREPAVGADLLALTAAVEEALHDPRSWSRDHTLRRVEDPTAADIRVLLATPSTVDRLCAETGLDTEGRYSCWNGTFAALNSTRWQRGAQDFDELTTYRRYLVNHEFGHGLGHGHLECPAPGALAPVMMQQTIGTGGCEANGWPYPDIAND